MNVPISAKLLEEWPDHTQLPCSDGAIVENLLELPQGMLLSDSIRPVLKEKHPDGRYCVGGDAGIYWTYDAQDPLRGVKAPDWFYVPDVEPMPPGEYRRSYVMWKEKKSPLLLIEFVSGDGSEERDRTPETGKFWVYERAIKSTYYAIYEVDPGRVEVYKMSRRRFRQMKPNEHGRYPIEPLGVELGIWRGEFDLQTFPWLRFWDANGLLLLTGDEREVVAQTENQRLRDRLRAAGLDPDNIQWNSE